MKRLLIPAAMLSIVLVKAQAQVNDYPIQPVDFTRVHVHDHFWQPKMEMNAAVSIPYVLEKCRETGRIENFLLAANKKQVEKLTDFTFDDTDLYKVIEGASYALQVKPDKVLEQKLDTLIAIIGKAQEPDGYLYTFRTANVSKRHDWVGAKRWEKEEDLSHELYNSGHLYEAAVAHYQATGKRTLLNIAIKNADLLVKDFGWGKEERYPGHQIVELGLARLYRVTGNKKYLDLAKFFLDVRGPKGEEYHQGHKKVVEQDSAVGHAVRATYMYTGMADVAALTGDRRYLEAIDKIWNDVVTSKIYLTGGIGATGNGEAFGKPYQLPNMSAYAETCASIANVYWNLRMFLLHGDARYIDVMERTLYNGLLSGISLSGDRFFYPNPLASMGQHQRSAWFSCACCISNMTRFLPSVPGYVYAQNNNSIFVNLFVGSSSSIQLPKGNVQLDQQTNYPWEGTVNIVVDPGKNSSFEMNIRIPGWAVKQPIPGDLYQYMDSGHQPVRILVNDQAINYSTTKGYAIIKRNWKKGDKVTLELPMKVEKVIAHKNVVDDAGRFAFQRGPIVYCLEGPDNKDSIVQNILVNSSNVFQAVYKNDFLNGVTVLQGTGESTKRQLNSDALIRTTQQVTAIPYYAWANRGNNEMMVWIPYMESAARPKPAPTIASTSKVSSSSKNTRSFMALNDQIDPAGSADQSNTYMHWWPKNNSMEFVQYDFDGEKEVSSSEVYWYDDGPFGGCRIPVSYKLYYRSGNDWIPVKNTTPYAIKKDGFNRIEFEKIRTNAMKLEFQLPADNSTGIHEWKLN
jgi:DUF1680 family protein